MLGRDLQLPIDLICERPEQEQKCVPIYVQEIEAGLVKTYEFAREKLKLASEHMKWRYDAKADYTVFDEGDAVWLYNPQRKKGVSPKLSRPWTGPYVVRKRWSIGFSWDQSPSQKWCTETDYGNTEGRIHLNGLWEQKIHPHLTILH